MCLCIVNSNSPFKIKLSDTRTHAMALMACSFISYRRDKVIVPVLWQRFYSCKRLLYVLFGLVNVSLKLPANSSLSPIRRYWSSIADASLPVVAKG